jgi:hypothetical protein
MKPNHQKNDLNKHKKPNAPGAGHVGANPQGQTRKVEGATAGLDIFDYAAVRADAKAFNDSRRKLIDYATINLGRASHIIEFEREYSFASEQPKPPMLAFVETKITEAEAKQHLKEQGIYPPIPEVAARHESSKATTEREDRNQAAELVYSNQVDEAKKLLETIDESKRNLIWSRYERQMYEHDKDIRAYELNKIRLYGVLWGQLSTAMRHKVKEDNNFNTFNEAREPLPLWLLVKKLTLEDRTSVLSNPYKRIEEGQRHFNWVRQLATEKVVDFYERFMTEVDSAEAAGVEFATKMRIEQYEALNGCSTDVARTQVREENLTMLFLTKLDRKRFGAILEEWENRLNDGDDIYPKSLSEALRRVNARKVDMRNVGVAAQGVAFVSADSHLHKGADSKRADGDNKFKGFKCYFCEQSGHKKTDCPLWKKAQAEISKEGKILNKPINLAMGIEDCGVEIAFHTDKESDDGCFTFSSEILKSAGILDPWYILADNQASISVFKNPYLVKNIRMADSPIRIKGVGGHLIVDQVAEFGNFGLVYFHRDAPANILCFYDLTVKYDVKFNNEYSDAFIVTTEKGTVKFEPVGKLYVYNTKSGFIKSDNKSSVFCAAAFPGAGDREGKWGEVGANAYGTSKITSRSLANGIETQRNTKIAIADENEVLVSTVAENKSRYSKKEVMKAELAHDLYLKLARPSVEDFSRMVRDGKILNCPITVSDIKRWIEIKGKDLGVIKGRTTRETPNGVEIEPIEAKLADESIILAADIFFIEGVNFFISISRKLNLIMVQNISDREPGSLGEAIRRIHGTYKLRGYRVDTIMHDGEKGIQLLSDQCNYLGIKLNIASKGEHVPEVERAIRQVKERVRGYMTTLPYRLTDVMIVHLVYYCVVAINSVPRKGEMESPKEKFQGVKVDLKKDWRLQWGAYVQVHNDDEVTNSMKSRTTGAMYMGPTGNAQGALKFLTLDTWKIVQRRTWTELPMPAEVIKVINDKVKQLIDAGEAKGSKRKQTVRFAPEVVQMNPPDAVPNGEYIDTQIITEEMMQAPQDLTEESSESEGESDEDSDESESDSESESEDSSYGSSYDGSASDRGVTIEDIDWGSDGEPADMYDEDDRYLSDIVDARKDAGDLLALITVVEDANPHHWVLNNMSVKEAIRKYGDAATEAVQKEFSQLKDKGVFEPMLYGDLSAQKQREIMNSLMFLKVKRDGTIKARFCANGVKQRKYLDVSEWSSPAVLLESTITSCVIDAAEERHIVVADIDGAYLYADMEDDEFIWVDPVLSAILLQIWPELKEYLTSDGKLLLRLKKALYGCVQSAKLFYEHLRKTLMGMGFKDNPYDKCVFNKMIDGKQCTIVVYVDDLKISCVLETAVEGVIAELQKVYKKIKIKRGKEFDYLGMSLDFQTKGLLKLHMKGYIDEVIKEMDYNGKVPVTPATKFLFEVDPKGVKLSEGKREKFHSVVASLLYLAKRGRPDVLLAVIFLTTRVSCADEDDWKKLERVIGYLKGTREMELVLGADDLTQMHAYIDASHAVHDDGKSHTGLVVTFGRGAVMCRSSKQKIVAKSSTVAELVGLSDAIDHVMWLKEFMSSQGYEMKPVVVHQDNQSTIVLAQKGRSNGQRTRHVNIRYFAVVDLVERKEIVVKYTGTEHMWADFFTKALQGKLFGCLCGWILGMLDSSSSQGCVGKQFIPAEAESLHAATAEVTV